MRAYLSLLSTRYRMALQYRTAAVAGAATQFFWGFILIMVLEAFYRSSDAPAPLPLPMAVSYVWLGQACFALLPWRHLLEIEAQIRRGDVVAELVRPLDLYTSWAMRVLATRLAAASLRAGPVFLVAAFVLPRVGLEEWTLAPPASLAAACWFTAALAAGVLLGTSLSNLVHASLLLTLSGGGLSALMPALVTIFSGMVVPLPLFPDWAQPLLSALPFRGLADVPFRVWTGHIPPSAAPASVALTLAWALALMAVGRIVMRLGLRRHAAQGG